jgi:hypothetical protein
MQSPDPPIQSTQTSPAYDIDIPATFEEPDHFIALGPPIAPNEVQETVSCGDKMLINGNLNEIYEVIGIYFVIPESDYITYAIYHSQRDVQMYIKVLKEWSTEAVWSPIQWSKMDGGN